MASAEHEILQNLSLGKANIQKAERVRTVVVELALADGLGSAGLARAYPRDDLEVVLRNLEQPLCSIHHRFEDLGRRTKRNHVDFDFEFSIALDLLQNVGLVE